MAAINKTFDINALVEKVFEILSETKRVPEIAPGVTSVEDILTSGIISSLYPKIFYYRIIVRR